MKTRISVYADGIMVNEMTTDIYESINHAVTDLKQRTALEKDLVLGNTVRATIIPTDKITKIEVVSVEPTSDSKQQDLL